MPIKSICFLILLGTFKCAFAEFVHYFGDEPRVLEVNANEKTLLAFPAPAYTQICQPSGVIALDTLVNRDEIQQILPHASAMSFIERADKSGSTQIQDPAGQGEERDSLVASLLKLTPLRQQGQTTCAIKLVSGETAMITFVLSETIQRPAVELQNIARVTEPAKVATKLGGLNIFRDLVSGGNLTYLIEISPNKNSHKTENARYRLVYLGSDDQNFKAWRFRGEARKDFTAPLFIESKMGQLLFSAWRGNNYQNPRKFAAGEPFEFYALTGADVSYTELVAKLP